MRRRLVLVAAWAAATAVAVAGSWVGLQPVLAATAPDLPTRLSAAQLHDLVPEPSPSPSPSPTPPPSPSPSPSPPPPPPDDPPSPGPLYPEVPSSDWEKVKGTERTFERTFALRGGEVTVRVNPREARVVGKTPNPGYEHRVRTLSRNSVMVEFQSADEDKSVVWIMWRNGPYAEVTETV